MKKILRELDIADLKAKALAGDYQGIKDNYVIGCCSEDLLFEIGHSAKEEIMGKYIGEDFDKFKRVRSNWLFKPTRVEVWYDGAEDTKVIVNNALALDLLQNLIYSFDSNENTIYVDFLEGRLDWIEDAELVGTGEYIKQMDGSRIVKTFIEFKLGDGTTKKLEAGPVDCGVINNIPTMKEGVWYECIYPEAGDNYCQNTEDESDVIHTRDSFTNYIEHGYSLRDMSWISGIPVAELEKPERMTYVRFEREVFRKRQYAEDMIQDGMEFEPDREYSKLL